MIRYLLLGTGLGIAATLGAMNLTASRTPEPFLSSPAIIVDRPECQDRAALNLVAKLQQPDLWKPIDDEADWFSLPSGLQAYLQDGGTVKVLPKGASLTDDDDALRFDPVCSVQIERAVGQLHAAWARAGYSKAGRARDELAGGGR